MRNFLAFCFCIAAGYAFAQPRYQVFDTRDPKLKSFSVYAQAGTANYFGDLCPTGDCYSNSKVNFGGGVTYRLNDYFFFNLNAQYYRIGASDIEFGNASRIKRNLSFRADNFEVCALANFEFLNYNTFRYLSRKEFPISMFIFTGVGFTTNNPKALYRGEYVALRPLKTEGVSYGALAAVLPIGLGIGYKVLDNLSVQLAAGYRFTSTDYLDDVSANYVDPSTLSPLAQSLAFRGNEVGFAGYGPGSKRGNPGSNDGYMLVNLRVEYDLPNVPFLKLTTRQTTKKSKSTISAPTRQIKSKKQ